MRMDREQLSAYDVINDYDEKKLADILYQYGEERLQEKLPKLSWKEEDKKLIRPKELADIVAMCYPPKERYKYATRPRELFKQLERGKRRIEGLKEFIYDIALYLRKGGRMCVITFIHWKTVL